MEVLEQQQENIANESTPSVTAPTSPTSAPGDDPPLHEVEVPSVDTVAGQEEFLAQLVNNEDSSTMRQPEPDPLLTLIQSKLKAGEDIRELHKQTQDQAVQRALAAAALQKPIKRKAARRNSEEASTWASHPGNDAGKRKINK